MAGTCVVDKRWKEHELTETQDHRIPTDRESLYRMIDDSLASLERILDQNDEPVLTELRDHGGWSTKDHVYHLAVCQEIMNSLFRNRPIHQRIGVDEESFLNLDVDGINDLIYRKTKDLSLAEVRDVLRSTYTESVEILSEMPFEDMQHRTLSDFGHVPLEDPNTQVLHWVWDNTIRHYDEHRRYIEEILRGAGGYRS